MSSRWSALLLSLLAAAPARASSVLDVDPSARSSALGSASAADAGNAWGMFSNPAGLAAVGSRRALLGQSSWVEGGDLQSAGVVLPFPKFTAGAGLARLSLGSFDGRDEQRRPQGHFSAEESAAVLSLAAGRPGLGVGASIKLLRERLGSSGSSAKAVDAGVSGGGRSAVSWGLALRNLRPDGEGSAAAGASVRWRGIGSLAAELRRPLAGGPVQAGLGWERGVTGAFALRAGYAPSLRGLSGDPAWRAGLGFRRGSTVLDYAVVPLGSLGVTQRLCLEQLF